MFDDIFVGFEDHIVVQLSRICCHMFHAHSIQGGQAAGVKVTDSSDFEFRGHMPTSLITQDNTVGVAAHSGREPTGIHPMGSIANQDVILH
jgi:hypothetical protein